MRSRWIRMGAPLLCAWVAGAGIAGCSKSTKPKPEAVNDTQPNANARIMSQTIFGDADKRTDVAGLHRPDDASLGFPGLYNSSRGVGVLNASGSLRWFQGTDGSTDVGKLSGTAIVPNGLVAVGGRDTDGDGKSDVGYAAL